MFAALREAIEQVDEQAVGPADVTELYSLRDLFDSRLSAVVGRFDATDAFVIEGAASTTAWLKHHARRSGPEASRVTKTARKLRHLPAVEAAWRAGRLSSAHVDAIVANVKRRHLELFAEAQDTIVDHLAELSVADAAMVMRWWALAADDEIPGPDNDDPANTVHLSRTLGGRGALRGSLGPDATAIVETALKVFDSDDINTPASERRADTLTAICQFTLDHHDKKTTRRNRPHVTVVMREGADGAPVGETLEGQPVTRDRLQQWLCDGLVGRVMMAAGQVLDYGTTTRVVPVALWHAVAVRDRGCRAGCCDRPVSWCEAHHVVPFSEGGTTSIDNLALFCSYHHHLLHSDSGWTATMHPDGRIDFTDPNGDVTTTYPPGLRSTLWPPGEDAA